MKKRVLAVVLAMAMVLGTITPAFGATVTVNTDNSLANAVANASDGDTIQVDGNITETGTVTIDKNIIITGEGTVTLSNTITVNNNGHLTVRGNVTLNGGNSVTVITVNNGGTLVMEGGTVTAGSNATGGGVKLIKATFTMTGGKITGNTASDAGGGVYVSQSSTFSMSGGEISHNTAANHGGGVDLRMDNNGLCTFNMSGGTITENTVSGTGQYSGGGGVRNDNCIFNMSGGAITNNHASSALGGGVLIYTGGTNSITGGTITGNNAGGNNGGGVHNLWGNNLTLGGNVTITGNTNATNGDSDIRVGTNQRIILNNLGANSQVGIITETTPSEGNPRVQFAQSANAGDDGCFNRNVLTFPGKVVQEGTDLYLVYDSNAYAATYSGKYYSTVADALAAAGADNGIGGDVVVNPNYTTEELNLTVPSNVTMKSGDMTIDGSVAGNEITVNVAPNAPHKIVITNGQGNVATTGDPVAVKGSDGNDYQVNVDPAGQKFTVMPSANGGIEKVRVNNGSSVIDGAAYTRVDKIYPLGNPMENASTGDTAVGSDVTVPVGNGKDMTIVGGPTDAAATKTADGYEASLPTGTGTGTVTAPTTHGKIEVTNANNPVNVTSNGVEATANLTGSGDVKLYANDTDSITFTGVQGTTTDPVVIKATDPNNTTFIDPDDVSVEYEVYGTVKVPADGDVSYPAGTALAAGNYVVVRENNTGALTLMKDPRVVLTPGQSDTMNGVTVTNPAGGTGNILLNTNDNTVTVPAGQTVEIDGKEYKASDDGDVVLTVNPDGAVTVISGKVELPNTDDSVKLGDVTITNKTTPADPTNPITVDGNTNTVEVPAGATVEIGGKTYTASIDPGDNKAVLIVDPVTGEVTLKEGVLDLDPGESVKVATGELNDDGTPKTIPVTNSGTPGVISVTAGTADTPIKAVTDMATNVTFGEGTDAKEYQAGDGTEIQYQGPDAPAKLASGTVNLDEGQSIVGASGKTITNPAGSGGDQVKVESNSIDEYDTVTVVGGTAGQTKVEVTDANGDTVTYQAEPDARLIVYKNEPTKLLDGTVNLTDGQEINVNPDNNGDPIKVESTGPVTVKKDYTNNTATAIIPNGSSIAVPNPNDATQSGSIQPNTGADVTVTLGNTSMVTGPIEGEVTANGQKYEQTDANSSYTLEVPYDGSTPIIKTGKLDLPVTDPDSKVKVNNATGTEVTNTGEQPITVKADDPAGKNTVTVPNGGSFTIPTTNGKDMTYENPSDPAKNFVIDDDGSVTVTLNPGEQVVIDGVTYTGGEPDGGSITVGPDGSITTTGNLGAEIDPEKFNEVPPFEYTLVPGVPVTVGGYVYETEDADAVTLSGKLQNGDGENKGNPIVTLANPDNKVTVSVSDGNGGSKPDTDKTYTAANENTQFTMHEPENTADSAKVDLLDNGEAVGANSALKFEGDPNNGNKAPDANVNGVDYTNATGDYTVEYNAVEKTDENGDPVLDEDGTPVVVVQNKVTAADTVKATFTEADQCLTVDGVTTADGSDKPVVADNAGASILIDGTKTDEREKITGVAPTVLDFSADKITAKRQESSGGNSYNLIVGPNGSVSITPQRANAGQIVTITAMPNRNHEVEQVTVTDRNGNPVSVISMGNNQYTFVQPANAPVEIRVTFTGGGSVVDKPVYNQCTKDANCPIHPFTDASATAWYHDGVHYVLDEGIMVGTSATTFRPYDNTTRGTIVTMLWRLMKSPVVNYNMTFGDVPAGTWYTEAVRWAAANDIVKGYSSTTFGPGDAITREQLATILYRYAEYRGYDVSARANLNSFVDHEQIGDYATEALAWANAKGLIIGTDANALAPKAQATRAETATIIMRFCESVAK